MSLRDHDIETLAVHLVTNWINGNLSYVIEQLGSRYADGQELALGERLALTAAVAILLNQHYHPDAMPTVDGSAVMRRFVYRLKEIT